MNTANLAAPKPRPDAPRSLPEWLAPVVQELELARKALVTAGDVRRIRPDLSPTTARRAIMELVRRGWLHPIGVRGTYEFSPGAAAGPFPSGDPWLVLRAELARQPDAFHVGAHSAAWLRGYAQRAPNRHVVVTASGRRVPQRLTLAYRVLTTTPAPAHDEIDGLPVPTPAELLAEIAQLAPRLALDASIGWLRRLLEDVRPEEAARELQTRSVTTRARAGYIAEVCGAAAHADAVAALGPLGNGPYYTGPRHTQASYAPRWRLFDTGKIA
jgi:hypothetical protein